MPLAVSWARVSLLRAVAMTWKPGRKSHYYYTVTTPPAWYRAQACLTSTLELFRHRKPYSAWGAS
jgi:hypothetical protein